MKVRIVKWPSRHDEAAVRAMLTRPAFDDQAEEAARRILADIRRRGDAAVAACAKQFDAVALRPADFAVSREEWRQAAASVDPAARRAIREAHQRVRRFALAGLRRDWTLRTPRGGFLGERFTPLDRVGVYVPGGTAPLVSTVIMTVTLARAAGVREIVACTPCRGGRALNPVLLHALDVAGATEVYRVGGIAAIGLMAYGTATVRKVDKIVGPGNAFVTAAKRQVYGHVALDLVAGPSEIAVLADDSADPRFVAADLLSQAEHGSGKEKALLVTPSRPLAEAVQRELEVQTARLGRQPAVRGVMRRGMLLVVVKDLAAGADLCNRFAPEHLELLVRQPRRWLRAVRRAGAVFLGPWSPECAGDYVAGPSHVLPTGGAAAMFSGLTVEDFRRRASVVAFSRRDLLDTLDAIETFGRIEGLDAHAAAARVRADRP